jgi:hypothetical protein
MMGNIVEDDLGEIYRQRGRWFLLLGALLGGIIALATAFGFWLENWGNHIGGGPGEDAHGIAVALAIVLTVVVIVVALLIWRARVLLERANSFQTAVLETTPHVSNSVNAAVAAWTSSALGAHTRGGADGPPAQNTGRTPTPINRSSQADPRAAAEQHLTVSTATELTVGSDSSNHTFAEIIQTLGSAGIAADALWSAAGPHGDQVYVVVRGAAGPDSRFTNAGLHVLASQGVVLAEFDDRPGAAADIFRRLTEAGVRVSSARLASSTRMVIVSDDPERVIQVLR